MKIIFCCLLVLYQVTGLGQKNITGTEQCKMAARQSYQYLIKKLNITEAAQKDSIKSIQEDFFCSSAKLDAVAVNSKSRLAGMKGLLQLREQRLKRLLTTEQYKLATRQ